MTSPRTTARLTNDDAQLECEQAELESLQCRVLARLILDPRLIPLLQEQLMASLSYPANSVLHSLIALYENSAGTYMRDVARAIVMEAKLAKKPR